MRLRILLFLTLVLLFNPTQSAFPFLKKAFEFVTGSNPLCKFGLTINSVVQLNRADPNSKLAVGMLKSLGEAFTNHEKVFDHKINKLHSIVNSQLTLTKDLIEKFDKHTQVFDHRMNELHSTVTLQHFQEKVNFPAHNLFMTATKYVNNPNKFMEKLLLNECQKHTPYTRLNDLGTMISQKWFLKQAEYANYRLPDVETIRLHIYNVMKELLFSHFICMAIQDEPVEGSPITDTVHETVTNIIDTIDNELDTIEKLFFPDFVVKEVKKLVEETDTGYTGTKSLMATTEIVLNMLRKTYGPGIVVNSKGRPLFVRDYEVQIGYETRGGKLPKNAVVDINVKGSWILITRADRFGVAPDFNPEVYVRRFEFPGEFKINLLEPDLFTEDVLAATWVHKDDPIIRSPKKSTYPTMVCKTEARLIVALTGAYLDPPADTPPTSFALKQEEELMAIQDLKSSVQAELSALPGGKTKSSRSSAASRYLATSVIMMTFWTVLFSHGF